MYDFGYLKPISKIIDVLGRAIIAIASLLVLDSLLLVTLT